PPPTSAKLPVGVPLAPLTATVTVRLWPTVRLFVAGVTVTVAVALPVVDFHALTTLATFNGPSPVASSKPVVAPYPERMPMESPLWITVQSGDPELQAM